MTADDIIAKLADIERQIEKINRIGSGSSGNATPGYVVPAGVKNGSNKVFTLAASPVFLILVLNRTTLKPVDDYTLNGNTITLLCEAPTADGDFWGYAFFGSPNFADGSTGIQTMELANEAANGTRTTFTFDFPIITDTETVYVGGHPKCRGAGNDYTVSGNTVTFATAPESGLNIQATYQTVLTTFGNANTLNGFVSPSSALVGVSDHQTLSGKILANPTVTGEITVNGGYAPIFRGSTADFNAALTQGQYQFGAANIVGAWTTSTIYGVLRVTVNDSKTHNNTSNWIWQEAWSTDGAYYWRYKVNNGSWSGWQLWVGDTGWLNVPAFQNNWVNYDVNAFGAAGYRKIGSIVYLRGLIKSGITTSGTTIFVLPEGFRPAVELIVTSRNDTNIPSDIRIRSNGVVAVGYSANSVSAGWTSLANISFVAS